MDLPFHIRALDEDGNTIRQSTTAYATAADAEKACARLTAQTGDTHKVCISLDPKDPRNDTKTPGKAGWMVYVPESAPAAVG